MEAYRNVYDVDKLKSLYNKYSFKPIPVKVSFPEDPSLFEQSGFQPKTLKVSWRVRDTYQLKSSIYQKNYSFNGKTYDNVGFPEELSETNTLQAVSLDGKRCVTLKTKSDSKGGKTEQYITICDKDGAKTTIDIKSINSEMTIIENPNLATFVLNETGDILLCVAEINDKSKSKEENSVVSKDYDINYHEYRQSWGEKFSTIYHTSVVVIELNTWKHLLIDKVGITLCQPFFYKNQDKSYSIGCIGFQELPYKLGLIYCTNRLSCIYGCKISSDFSDISPIDPETYYGNGCDLSITSPRVHYNKLTGYDSRVFFLERNAGGAHNKSARLRQFCFDSKKVKTILDNVEERKVVTKTNGDVSYSDIGPIFTHELPQNCFSSDGKYFIYDSDTPLSSRPFAVNVDNGTVRILNFPLDYCHILEVKHDLIVAIGSSINILPNVYIGRFSETSGESLNWIALEDEKNKQLENIKFDTFMFASRDFPNKYVTGIWTSPVDLVGKPSATVFIPHGGPHTQYQTCYYQSIALYTELGLKTCLINFVGSSGVDEEYNNILLGKIGITDVHDVYDAIQHMIAANQTDKDRIILNGGSHGGFLVTNISGQHPELNFLACIARNPVLHVSAMCAITDIPEWNVAEALGIVERRPYSEIYARNSEEVSRMYQLSPIAHIGNVKVPTLLLLGKEDLRVPYLQGIQYHRLLKARGVETRCLIYDDVHDLYKINVDFDCFINVAKFIEKLIYYSS